MTELVWWKAGGVANVVCPACGKVLPLSGPCVARWSPDSFDYVMFIEDLRTAEPSFMHAECFAEVRGYRRLVRLIVHRRDDEVRRRLY
ncbi:hypothetical protein ACIA8G_18445 [Lentzea sp. NPDC051213]|uniref:hypothetical protein n=1 Tax=Lentzea sp. NPDC051213 TaxID=3364126 RepID=UPI0037A0BD5E